MSVIFSILSDFIKQLSLRYGRTRDLAQDATVQSVPRNFCSQRRSEKNNNPIITRQLARRFSGLRLMQRWHSPSARRLLRLFVAARLSIRLTHGCCSEPLLSGSAARPGLPLFSDHPSRVSGPAAFPVWSIFLASGGVWGSEEGMMMPTARPVCLHEKGLSG